MIGEVVPPGWLLRPQSWPYWMPNTLLGQLPPLGLPTRRCGWSQRHRRPRVTEFSDPSPETFRVTHSRCSVEASEFSCRSGVPAVFEKKALLLGCSR
jgi:hypothetical protein